MSVDSTKKTNVTKQKIELPNFKYGTIWQDPISGGKTNVTKQKIELPDFKYGAIWQDPTSGHKIGCLDASKDKDVEKLMGSEKAILAIQDPPYNVDINDEFGKLPVDKYINWCEKWIDNTINVLDQNSSLYVWLGADIKNVLQPLPDFMIMMRKKPIQIRNFITMRNQRGYGTQKN